MHFKLDRNCSYISCFLIIAGTKPLHPYIVARWHSNRIADFGLTDHVFYLVRVCRPSRSCWKEREAERWALVLDASDVSADCARVCDQSSFAGVAEGRCQWGDAAKRLRETTESLVARYAYGVAKLRPAGRIPCTFFPGTIFSTVDSGEKALTVACHVNRTVSGPPVARQSRIWPSGQNVWQPLTYAQQCATSLLFCCSTCVTVQGVNVIGYRYIDQESATLFNKRTNLLHLPEDMVGVEPQNVDIVSFFMRIHKNVGYI